MVAALFFVLTHRRQLGASFNVLATAEPWHVAQALGLCVLTFGIAAAIYGLLALKPLRFERTCLVELAAACVNRLLPAGLGSLGLHGAYLYKQRHTVAEATAVVSINNALGIVAHLSLLVGAVLYQPGLLERFHVSLPAHAWKVPFVLVALCVLAVCVFPGLRTRLVGFGHNLYASFRLLRARPLRLVLAVFLAVLLTLTYTSILFMSARSLGLVIGFLPCFIIFSVGMLAGTSTPTPGGLVGAEAGLLGALVAYGIPVPDAGAAVLLFRLVTYWMPIVPGAIALIFVRRFSVV